MMMMMDDEGLNDDDDDVLECLHSQQPYLPCLSITVFDSLVRVARGP